MIEGGLVIQGGGARGAFAAGVLDVLLEEKLLFSKVYGTSAGALCACNYLSGDLGRSHFIVTELMRDKRFVSARNLILTGNLFNFKYLFHVIPKKKAAFNEEAFFANPAEFYACVTSLETGKEEYLPKTQDKATTYKAIAASSSLPLYSKPIKIGKNKYLDGGQVAPIPYGKPIQDGVEKVVIVLTRQKGYVQPEVKESVVKKANRKYGKHPEFVDTYIHGATYFNNAMADIEALEEKGRVFVIRPDIPPAVGIAETNKEKLEELYQQGKEACRVRLQALREYLAK